jgi:spore coat protein U-like protein
MKLHWLQCLSLFVLLLATSLFLPRRADATVTCNASATSVNFGVVDPQQAGNTQASGSISFSCQNDAFLQTAYVTLCLNIGAGTGGTTAPYRQMSDGAGHNLQFQLYQDGAHTQIWGSVLTPATPTPLQVQFQVPGAALFGGNGTYDSPPYTVYGLVPGNQTGIVAGGYNNMFSGANASITLAHKDAFLGIGGSSPSSCGSGNTSSFPFSASATVQQVCTVSATTLNFGSIAGFLTGNHDGTSTVSVKCVNGTAYKVGLDNGQHGTRRMQGPGGYISYELYRDSGRTQRWGTNLGVDTASGTGSGNPQNITVFGRVPAQTTPSAGTYSDTVTVTVTY